MSSDEFDHDDDDILALARSLVGPTDVAGDARAWVRTPAQIEQLNEGVIDAAALDAAASAFALSVPKGLSRVPWIETLSLCTPDSRLPAGVEPAAIGEADDVKREEYFASLAQVGVHEGFTRLRAMAISGNRPAGFVTAMFKADPHREQARQQGADERKAIKAVETRKTAQDARVQGIEAKAQQLQERAKKKRAAAVNATREKGKFAQETGGKGSKGEAKGGGKGKASKRSKGGGKTGKAAAKSSGKGKGKGVRR